MAVTQNLLQALRSKPAANADVSCLQEIFAFGVKLEECE